MTIILFLISAYVILESIYAAQHLDKGGKLCQFLRYLFSAISGALGCYLAFAQSNHDDFLIAITAIALNLWPQTYYRFTTHFDRRWRS